MNDPNREELISAYLDGELSAEEQVYVERLLAESPELRRWCDEMAAMRSRLQALPRRRLGTDFAAAIAARAQQAQADQPAAAAASSIPAALPAAARPPVAAPQKEEPEVTPAKWPFANLSPRMLFWPLAALAAGLALMVFVPQEKETPIAVNGPADRRSEATPGFTTFSDADGEKSVATPAGSTATEGGRAPEDSIDRSGDSRRSGIDRKFGISQDPVGQAKSLDSTTRDVAGKESGKSGQEGAAAKNGADATGGQDEYREADELSDKLYIVEVTVPAEKWNEETSTRALARQKIALDDHEKRRDGADFDAAQSYERGTDLDKPNPHGFADDMRAKLREVRDLPIEKLKSLAEGWKGKRQQGSSEDWFAVAATPDSLQDLIRESEAQGSRVAVVSVGDEAKKGGNDLGVLTLQRELGRLSLRAQLDRLEADGAERTPLGSESGAKPGESGDGPRGGNPPQSPAPPLVVKAADPKSPANIEPVVVPAAEPARPAGPSLAPGPAPVSGPVEIKGKDQPATKSEGKPEPNPAGLPLEQPQSQPGEPAEKKPQAKPQPKLGDDLRSEWLAEENKAAARYGNVGNFNGRAVRLNLGDQPPRDEKQNGAAGHGDDSGHRPAGGGGLPGAGSQPMPTPPLPTTIPVPGRPSLLTPLERKVLSPDDKDPAVKEPAGFAKNLAGRGGLPEGGAQASPRKAVDDLSDKRDFKEAEQLGKLRQKPVRLVVVFRRGPASASPAAITPPASTIAPPVTSTPAAEKALPESKK